MYNNVLITGGTGTFGTSYILKSIENGWHRKIIVFSRDEFKQTRLSRYLRNKFKSRLINGKDFSITLDNCEIRFFIGDIANIDRLKVAMKGVDLVIHAAALKHVPVCEYNPEQAIDTNIIGALNVAKAAAAQNVSKVVALSTDKAADPINLYGATKLCLEKVFLGARSYYHDTTSFHIVRYGNVIASRGSIIEILSDKNKEDFTLTEPSMTRFWISIEDAIELTRFAIENGISNEIFVPKMLSLEMESVFKWIRPDIVPEITGIRSGEKLHETMISKNDLQKTYDLGFCYVIESEIYKSPLIRGIPVVKLDEYTSNSSDRFTKTRFLKKVIDTMINDVSELQS